MEVYKKKFSGHVLHELIDPKICDYIELMKSTIWTNIISK